MVLYTAYLRATRGLNWQAPSLEPLDGIITWTTLQSGEVLTGTGSLTERLAPRDGATQCDPTWEASPPRTMMGLVTQASLCPDASQPQCHRSSHESLNIRT